MNSHLQRVGAHVNDLYHDLKDGKKLILLLEILSGEKLPKPSKGRMRIHMCENVDKALTFLKQKKVNFQNSNYPVKILIVKVEPFSNKQLLSISESYFLRKHETTNLFAE